MTRVNNTYHLITNFFFDFQRSSTGRPGFAICAQKRCIPTLQGCVERITGILYLFTYTRHS